MKYNSHRLCQKRQKGEFYSAIVSFTMKRTTYQEGFLKLTEILITKSPGTTRWIRFSLLSSVTLTTGCFFRATGVLQLVEKIRIMPYSHIILLTKSRIQQRLPDVNQPFLLPEEKIPLYGNHFQIDTPGYTKFKEIYIKVFMVIKSSLKR